MFFQGSNLIPWLAVSSGWTNRDLHTISKWHITNTHTQTRWWLKKYTECNCNRAIAWRHSSWLDAHLRRQYLAGVFRQIHTQGIIGKYRWLLGSGHREAIHLTLLERTVSAAGWSCLVRVYTIWEWGSWMLASVRLGAGKTVWACSKQQCRWWQLMEKASQLRWLSHDSTPHHSPMIGTLYPLCWLDTAINDDGKNKTKTNNINLKCHEVYFLEKTANVASMHKSAVWSIFTDPSTSASPL